MHAQSFVNRRITNRKRMPQVPHLVNRQGTTGQTNPVGQPHHYVLDNSQPNLLPLTHTNSQKVASHLPYLPYSEDVNQIGGTPIGQQNKNFNSFNSNRQNQYQRAYPDGPSQMFDGDREMDQFLNKAASLPLNEAIEVYFKYRFNAKDAFFWEEIPDLQMLHCQTIGTLAPHSSGMPGSCLFTRSVVRLGNPTIHQNYDGNIDGQFCSATTPVMLLPIWDYRNTICGVVEVIKPQNSAEFTQSDEDFADWFIRKYKLLSRFLSPIEPLEGLTLDVVQLMRNEQFIAQVLTRIASFFNCRTCDVWEFEKSSQKITKFSGSSEKAEIVDQSMAGIAGDSLTRENTVYCTSNKLHSSYNVEIDGENEEAVLAVSIKEPEDNKVYSVVLRGPKNGKLFNLATETNLKRAAPIIVAALSNAEAFTAVDDQFQSSRVEREGLAALLEVVEVLSSQLDTEKLTELIMEKGRSLTNSDRCSLFLVNESRDRLITRLHQGLQNAIDIPINKGIAGKTVLEKRVLNIADAYETDFFDSTTDIETGYKTKSILSVPIINNRGEVIGVTEMVNKIDNKPFTQWDTNLIQIFNVFCGISLENAKLYRESIETQNLLRSFFDVSFSMSKKESSQKILNNIMQKAKNAINASYSSIWLIDESKHCFGNFLSDIKNYPKTIPLEVGIAGSIVNTRQGVIENDPYHNPQFNRQLDQISNVKTTNLVGSPVINTKGEILGVVQMINKLNDQPFNARDLQVISTFTSFASVVLENSRLRDIATFGDAEIEMTKWVGESERKLTNEIPQSLVLTEQQQQEMRQLNCFAVDYRGIGHIKCLFYLFNNFHILEKFKITNEVFFRFIFTISQTYNQVPYHNWTHACDVTQYISYEIITGRLTEKFTDFEIFGLLTAAVCHDANHEGFNNVFNVKAETPFGILFKNTSVMEMHHITVAIPIITKDDINLFHSLNSDELKKMWNLFIQLILATDMAHHFELVKNATTLMDENKWDESDPEVRLLSLRLILKVADISNVSRPFSIADKWCDILNLEFFRQGDLEKSTGIGLTSPLNDRENSDKPKSQIGFYNFICLPLYSIVARIFPELQVNVDSVKSNLEVWKSMIPPPPAEEKK
ncbi:3'5'-cyclic nucleotide phosphodiesterase family protein [Tritrichomonas foetus]|uniref:3'5'-cyclic nucleotide phosphodiesterase family protein n=1 Tax=Tritrichomonas foetus TaxID=1144522 RepID=A0A1J4KY62_9EUKA|nr:3'5'-cyclic nucleotide phosphodiesterase family protein [Tritrichomonas foetus]|eukprot:OHT14644.1 3'5'-cyclic nucleotide phosphodiesterase family protein [Tritrichomonas foetus]